MFLARVVVPKLVREVPDASRFALIVSVDCCLSCQKHNLDAELRMSARASNVNRELAPDPEKAK